MKSSGLIFSIGCREQASSASGKAVSGMSSDEKNQVLRKSSN